MKRLFLLATVIATISVVASCNQIATNGDYKLEVSEQVKIDEPIMMRLGDTLSFKESSNQEAAIKKNVSFSPKIDFDVEVLNSQTALIHPKSPLKYKTTYKMGVNVGKIIGAKSSKKSYSISVVSPVLRYTDGKLSILPDEENFFIEGTIESSDPIDGKYIEAGMTVSRSGCTVAWSHSDDGRKHGYKIDNIVPEAQSYKLTVKRDYSMYDDREIVEITYDVPAKGEFSVLASEVFLEPYRFEIVFSSVLDKRQIYNNLITMPGAGKLKFLSENNKLVIYPSVKAEGHQKVTIDKLIKNTRNGTLNDDWSRTFQIPSDEPSVKFVNKGAILPSSSGMNIQFQAVNYEKIRVRVKQIYENNVLQYLQSNSLNSTDSYIDRVARTIKDTTFALGDPTSVKLKNIAIYGLNLSDIVKIQKGAIYKVEIRGVNPLVDLGEDYWESDYYFGNWSDYGQRSKNILVSDLGVIVKGSDLGEYTFFVTNLLTTAPVSGAKIMAYNNVNQLVGEATTNGEGKAVVTSTDKPYSAIISAGQEKTYIKIGDSPLSISNFEVGGTAVQKGQKGFIFGERGVWRPGDDIYLTFISMVTDGKLPDNHPVTAVLCNPQGQEIKTITNNSGMNGMYTFKFSTDANAPTGNWSVRIEAGGVTYNKTVKIETVKPNKLLINFALDQEPVPFSSIKGSVSAKWLVGNPAANLETRVEAELTRASTSFKGYPNYVFEDLSRGFYSQGYNISSGKTDSEGNFYFNSYITKSREIPGLINVMFTTRVFEPSGDFSIDNYATVFSPFDTYIGINMNEEESAWGSKYWDIKKPHTVDIVAVNASGATLLRQMNVSVDVYRIGWNWWWGSSYSELASYSRDSYNQPYKSFNVTLKNGKGSFDMDMSAQESGYFFFRVTDPNGGHAASRAVMVSSGYYEGDDGRQDAAVKLTTSLDKENYKVGETARLTIPSAVGAKALVSLEKGEKVVKSFWVDCKGASTEIAVPLTADMTPNIYASVTLIQPHNNTVNDAPIRMFGIQRINVEDAATHLNPVIAVPDEIRPESEVTVTVSEQSGRPMSYVLALVDEGLLSLTRYRTPNPWDTFYATEALGVSTWDLYDLVIGAYGTRMEQLFAIGGDGEESGRIVSNLQAERFKPVSMFMGPFTVKAKGKEKHKVTIPPYIGNMRVMVVATDGKAQGCAEKNVSVKKPVMVQASMSRVIGTEEEIILPVTVFSTQDNIGKVTVKIETNSLLSVPDSDTQSVTSSRSGEQMVYFRLKASAVEGIGTIKTIAKSSSDEAHEEIEIDVRNPNPPTTTSVTVLLKSKESKKIHYDYAGMIGTNRASIEASTLPPADLDFRLKYLIGYPHGCIEQTVSAAFPQLYLGELMTLSGERSAQCEANIKAAIAKLPSFAIAGGGFTYWPGTSAYAGTSVWGTIYAAHFMIEAQAKGYAVPVQLRKNALKYIKSKVSGTDLSAIDKAYGCYVLALSGDAPRGVMNRMREEITSYQNNVGWMLAAAYAADGKKDVSRNVIEKISGRAEGKIDPFSWSFESMERNEAVIAMTYNSIGEKVKAFKVVETLSGKMNNRAHYMSTQSTAWALKAVADYSRGLGKGGVNVIVKAAGNNMNLIDDKSFAQSVLDPTGARAIDLELVNNSDAPAYVVVSSTGIPEKGEEIAQANGLRMVVNYNLADGTAVDPFNLEQGTDFNIVVNVLNTSTTNYTNMALTQIIPSGWEIRNDRSEKMYQDYRDDRVYSYFDLNASTSHTITIRATATYKGRFYLPSFICEAMYDETVNASSKGGWCTVR